MVPILSIAIPVLIITVIVVVLNPKSVVVIYDHPTTVIINKPPRGHIYFSSTWGAKPEPFKYQTQEDPAELNPIFDGLSILMNASEARMKADIDAIIMANKFLAEIAEESRQQLQKV